MLICNSLQCCNLLLSSLFTLNLRGASVNCALEFQQIIGNFLIRIQELELSRENVSL